MTRYNNLVSYHGNVYTYECRFGKIYAEICPLGGGEVIAVKRSDLKIIPTPGMITTYCHAGT